MGAHPDRHGPTPPPAGPSPHTPDRSEASQHARARPPAGPVTRIGVRLGPDPYAEPGAVPIGSAYTQQWWLPVLGPTCTCLLAHAARHADTYTADWQWPAVDDLAVAVGLGAKPRHGFNSPLLRALDRLAQFQVATWVSTPRSATDDARIAIHDTVRLVPEPATRRWPDAMRADHAADLADLARTRRTPPAAHQPRRR